MTGLGTSQAAPEQPAPDQGPAADAVLPAVKSAKPQTIRELERALRGLGYSQREATGIAKHGFKAIGGADETEGLDALAALLAKRSSPF